MRSSIYIDIIYGLFCFFMGGWLMSNSFGKPNVGSCWALNSYELRMEENSYRILDKGDYGVKVEREDMVEDGYDAPPRIGYVLYSDLLLNYVQRDCLDVE